MATTIIPSAAGGDTPGEYFTVDISSAKAELTTVTLCEDEGEGDWETNSIASHRPQ